MVAIGRSALSGVEHQGDLAGRGARGQVGGLVSSTATSTTLSPVSATCRDPDDGGLDGDRVDALADLARLTGGGHDPHRVAGVDRLARASSPR